jgi:hypothetical protein
MINLTFNELRSGRLSIVFVGAQSKSNLKRSQTRNKTNQKQFGTQDFLDSFF